jgi:hypothetical protein
MTTPISRLRDLHERLPKNWKSFYHNRTEAWTVTYEKDGCDSVNDEANAILMGLDGSCSYSEYTSAVSHMRNMLPELLELVEAAQWCVESPDVDEQPRVDDDLRKVLSKLKGEK